MNKSKQRISTFCNDALGTLDAVGVAQKISKGEISSAEAVEAAIARARSINPEINAIVTETFDLARKQVKNIIPGPFAGVPSFIKDTDDVAGVPTLWGSRAVPNKPTRKSKKFIEQFFHSVLSVWEKARYPNSA